MEPVANSHPRPPYLKMPHYTPDRYQQPITRHSIKSCFSGGHPEMTVHVAWFKGFGIDTTAKSFL
jgi:hypothetical protein